MPKHRISLDFTDEAYKALKRLQTTMKQPTMAEVIRKALGLFDTWIDLEKQGYTLYYEKDDEKVELRIML